MSFDKRMQLCNYQHNRDVERFHHPNPIPQKPLCSQSLSPSQPQPLAATDLLFTASTLPLLEVSRD